VAATVIREGTGMTVRGTFELPRQHISIEVTRGCALTEAADLAGIVLNTSCAGQGTCGGCSVDLLEGVFQNGEGLVEVSPGRPRRALGCQTRIVANGWRVAVPRRSLVEAGEKIVSDYDMRRPLVLSPSVRKVCLSLPVPTLDDSVGDLERIDRALRQAGQIDLPLRPDLDALRKLPGVLPEADYRVTVTLALNQDHWELIDVEKGDTSGRLYGIAVDIGTTTVVCALVDLIGGRVIDKASCYNQQVQRADDVASRIVHSQRPGGLEDLQRLVVTETVDRLVRLLCHGHDIEPPQISRMVVSGNTIMSHLFLGLDPGHIGGIPFQPVAACPGTFSARRIGLAMSPAGLVDVVPSISGYVGGDITSDLCISQMDTGPERALLVDLGTNGEIAVCDRGRLVVSATAAGPAFEGGRIGCGMRASTGAIEHIRIDPATLEAECDVIGDTLPIGICGSGLIDLIAEGFRAGLMDPAGRFDAGWLGRSDRLRAGPADGGGLEYVVVPRDQTEDGRLDIVVNERDVATLLQAKAATYAGITILLNQIGHVPGDLDVVYLAGGFARHVDLRNAVTMGLLPDVPLGRYRILGNGSLAGSVVGLLDRQVWEQFRRISVAPAVIELNTIPEFQDEFVNALFLPNMLTERFPSVRSGCK
jgi:uncharacterized 2Fe-2S/4Fe-4S cluster protein (DUF4445 family)